MCLFRTPEQRLGSRSTRVATLSFQADSPWALNARNPHVRVTKSTRDVTSMIVKQMRTSRSASSGDKSAPIHNALLAAERRDTMALTVKNNTSSKSTYAHISVGLFAWEKASLSSFATSQNVIAYRHGLHRHVGAAIMVILEARGLPKFSGFKSQRTTVELALKTLLVRLAKESLAQMTCLIELNEATVYPALVAVPETRTIASVMVSEYNDIAFVSAMICPQCSSSEPRGITPMLRPWFMDHPLICLRFFITPWQDGECTTDVETAENVTALIEKDGCGPELNTYHSSTCSPFPQVTLSPLLRSSCCFSPFTYAEYSQSEVYFRSERIYSTKISGRFLYMSCCLGHPLTTPSSCSASQSACCHATWPSCAHNAITSARALTRMSKNFSASVLQQSTRWCRDGTTRTSGTDATAHSRTVARTNAGDGKPPEQKRNNDLIQRCPAASFVASSHNILVLQCAVASNFVGEARNRTRTSCDAASSDARRDVLIMVQENVIQKHNVVKSSSKALPNSDGAPRRKNKKISPHSPRSDERKKNRKKAENAKVDENNDDVDRDRKEPPPDGSKRKINVIVVAFCCLAFAALVVLLLFLFVTVEVIVTILPTSTSTHSHTSVTVTAITAEDTVGTVAPLYCDTEFCDREASYIKDLLSKNKGPCDNFYDYVCEEWSKQHPVRGSGVGDAVSIDTLIEDELSKLVQPLLMTSQSADVRLAASLYSACSDREKKNAAMNEIKKLYKRWTIGEWPRREPPSSSDVWTFGGQLVRDMGLDALVRVSLMQSSHAHRDTVAQLDKPRFIFSCNDASRQRVTRLLRTALVDVTSETSPVLLDEVIAAFVRFGSAPLLPAVPDTDLSTAYATKLSTLDAGYRDFLGAAFHGTRSFDDVDTDVVVRSSDYVRHFLPTAVRELRPRATVNYLGFLVLVQVAPFLPDKLRSLRQLFAKYARGRTVEDADDTASLCLIAVERVLPACFGRVLAKHFKAVQEQMKQRLHELEAIFSENLAYINWVDNVRAVLARYQLKRDVEPVSFYQQIAEQQQAKDFDSVSVQPRLLAQICQNKLRTAVSVPVAWWSRSELSTWPSPDWSRRTVQVPAALFNVSVVEGAPLSLHASRYSVRLYRALVQLLLFPTDADVADAGEWLGDRGRALRSLLSCFEWDIRQLPMPLRNLVAPDPDASRGSALQQTVALQMAFRAYQKLMRGKGNRDFRYRALSNLSSAQLFFIYYALDNCESGDVVYGGHLGHMLPASYRVNVAVRHVLEFWDAFQCPEGSAMTQLTLAAACSVVRQDAWYRSLQVD